jgi:hypothetical protein
MSHSSSENFSGSSADLTGMDLVHLGFKSRVIALDRETGDEVLHEGRITFATLIHTTSPRRTGIGVGPIHSQSGNNE